MFPLQRDFYRLAVAAIFVFTLVEHVNGLDMEYCSTLNTASTSSNSSIYQSDGLCFDFCVDDYAFAVVQGEECWCTNYIPGTTASTTNCANPCPGYPDDTCGGDDTYGYISLSMAASGTKGAATSTSATSTKEATSSPSPTPVIIFSTVTEPAVTPTPSTSSSTAKTTSKTEEEVTPASTTSSSPQITSSPPAKTSSDSDSDTTSTWTPTPVISLETITGQVRTVTVTPTAPPSAQSAVVSSTSKSGLSTGGAVGLTIGLVALIAIIGGVSYFCVKKRRQEKAEEYAAVNSRRESLAGLGGPIPSRTMSENSRYILGTDGRRVVETWEDDADTPGSRKSQLVPVDPRLNPFAPVYLRGENQSRESFNTIRDDHDYSRRVHQQGPILRATNPDAD